MIVRMGDGQILVGIARDAIIQCFGLNRSTLKSIDLRRLKTKYGIKKDFYREQEIPHYRNRMFQMGKNYILNIEKEPFDLVAFENIFFKIYYALCQILGMGMDCRRSKIPIELMMMSIKIQHPQSNELYNFSTYIQHKLHEVLMNAKDEKAQLDFIYYLLLWNLILFQGQPAQCFYLDPRQ